MPGVVTNTNGALKKRKLEDSTSNAVKAERRTKVKKTSANNTKSDIATLETSIQESQRNYNNIAILLSKAHGEIDSNDQQLPANVALCRVFSRLFLEDRLIKHNDAPDNQKVVVEWLRARLQEYQECLWLLLRNGHPAQQETALTLSLQLVKAELDAAKSDVELAGRTGIFRSLVRTLLSLQKASVVLDAFVSRYLLAYDDLRHYFFRITQETPFDPASTKATLSNITSILLALEYPTNHGGQLDTYYHKPTGKTRIPFSAHRKAAQQSWLTVLNKPLSKEQRKTILHAMTDRIVPWFPNTRLLMDFLTDSFNVGGATSLLALSGLFHLIQEHNLDYPDFYPKLYSMLDADLLHSKHRSRFFRLMTVFLSSTHLPAALVASFIKRFSRLALHAPPAGIVAVMPWIYNMFKSHPTTTFMMHHVPRTDVERASILEKGAEDSFDMDESDPMITGAIDSCVWELVTLQNHYHPNVASLARIISEQFTKNHYNLEDFLDHSYTSLLEGELSRELKKTPVAEWQIPKTVFKDHWEGGGDRLEVMMESILTS